jgi:hypothetical protein
MGEWVGTNYLNGRPERSGAHAFQLRYEIAPVAGLLVEVASAAAREE